MKLCVGFLLDTHARHPDIWMGWAHGHDVTFIAHCHKGRYTGAIPLTQTPTVKTTWDKTRPAHYELYKAFLQTDCDYLQIVSERCVPIRPLAEFVEFLNSLGGRSVLSSVNDGNWAAHLARRHIYQGAKPYVKYHEQWVLLSRQHVEVLVTHAELCRSWFINAFADNEHFPGTILNYAGRIHEVDGTRHVYTDWSQGGAHPRLYLSEHKPIRSAKGNGTQPVRRFKADVWGEMQASGAFFARKFDDNVDNIGWILEAATSNIPRPPMEILAHIHCFHPQHLEECVAALKQWPESTTLVVTYPQKNKVCKEAIERVCPNAEVIALPNRGRDVLPFLHVLRWAAKQGKQWQYVFKAHTKKDEYPNTNWADKGNWRKSLLAPLANWLRVKSALDATGVGIVGQQGIMWEPKRGKFWGTQKEIDLMLACCKAAGTDGKLNAPFIAGTMFAARWEALEPWVNAQLPEFEPEPLHWEGTVAHGMERAFSALALANGFKTVGI